MARISILTLLAVLLMRALGFSQTPAQASAPAAPAATAATAVTAATTPGKNTAAVEPQGYTYNADGRRDPFVSLLRRGATEPAQNGRRGGLAGLTAAEISLRGTLKSDGAIVGIAQGADSKTYIVRAGDKLADGSIRSISATEMVILQQVSDPLALQQEREVRKLLRQTEEGK